MKILPIKKTNINSSTPLCLLWYLDSPDPLVTSLETTTEPYMKSMIQKKAKQLLLRTIVSCPVPDMQRNKVPSYVSLVDSECETPTNLLKVIYNKPR